MIAQQLSGLVTLLVGMFIGIALVTMLLAIESFHHQIVLVPRKRRGCTDAAAVRFAFHLCGATFEGENIVARITNKQQIAFTVTGKTASGDAADLTGLAVKSSDETIATVSGSLSADGLSFSGAVVGIAPGVAQITVDDPQSDGSDPVASGAIEVVHEGVATLELDFGSVSQQLPTATVAAPPAAPST